MLVGESSFRRERLGRALPASSRVREKRFTPGKVQSRLPFFFFSLFIQWPRISDPLMNRVLKTRDIIDTRKLFPPRSRPTLDRNDSDQAILKGKRRYREYVRIGVIEEANTPCEIVPSTSLTTWRILNDLQLSGPPYQRGVIDDFSTTTSPRR